MSTSTRLDVGRRILALGAALGFLAVGLGAFGAHGLEKLLSEAPDGLERAAWWETAAHYHLLHALAVVVCGLVPGGGSRGAASAFTLGILIFSGTLYAMALGAPRWFGAITPLGGVVLMVGWALFGLHALRGPKL